MPESHMELLKPKELWEEKLILGIEKDRGLFFMKLGIKPNYPDYNGKKI